MEEEKNGVLRRGLGNLEEERNAEGEVGGELIDVKEGDDLRCYFRASDNT